MQIAQFRNNLKQAIANMNRGNRPVNNDYNNTSDLSGMNRQQAYPKQTQNNVSAKAPVQSDNIRSAAGKPKVQNEPKPGLFASDSANRNYAKGQVNTDPIYDFGFLKNRNSDDVNNLRSNYVNDVNDLLETSQDEKYQALTADPLYNDYMSDKDKEYVEKKNAELSQKRTKALTSKGDYGTAKELEEKSDFGRIRDEDVFHVDEEGNVAFNDFEGEIETLKEQKREIQLKAFDKDVDSEEYQKMVTEIDDQIEELNRLSDYQEARYRSLVYEYAKSNGSQDELNYLAKRQGSYGNSSLERIGLGLTSSGVQKLGGAVSMYEGLSNAIDYSQIEEYQDSIDLKTKAYELAEDPKYNLLMEKSYEGYQNLTEEEQNYIESVNSQIKDLMDQADEMALKADEKYATMDKMELGTQLTQIANELSFMQNNGASQTQKLIVNTIVNVADNMSLQAAAYNVAGRAGLKAGTAVMSLGAFGNSYNEAVQKGYSPQQAYMYGALNYATESLTEMFGGERMIKLFEGSRYLPSTFAGIVWENTKSGGAEMTEEGVGWAIDPFLNMIALGEVPSIESWDPQQLKESLSVAFCAGSAQGTLIQMRNVFDNYSRVSSHEGKQNLTDVLNVLNQMKAEASTDPITLEDGSTITEREIVEMFEQSAQNGIDQFYEMSALKDAVQFEHENKLENYTEELTPKADEVTQVTRDNYIDELNKEADKLYQKIENVDVAQENLRKLSAEEEERAKITLSKNISTDGVVNRYNIKNINDVHEVSSKAIKALKKTYLSDENNIKPIHNEALDIDVEIRPSSINESFRRSEAYDHLNTNRKIAKIAVLDALDTMVKYGEIRKEEADNYHTKNSNTKFNYLAYDTKINGIDYTVKMDIKKTRNGNRLYIYNIELLKNDPSVGPDYIDSAVPLDGAVDNNIQDDNDVVKSSENENDEEEGNHYYATIAPYLDTVLTEENRQKLIDLSEQVYDAAAQKIAESLGIESMPKTENIGGYENDEGKRLREVSWTFDLKGVDAEKAKMFSSLMGDLAFENQEAVICMKRISDDSHMVGEVAEDGGTYGREYTFVFRDLETVEKALKASDIANYNIDRNTNTLTVQDFGFDKSLPEKLDILLGGENYESCWQRPIFSYYLQRENRKSLYEAQLNSEEGQREGNGRLEGDYAEQLSEALRRVSDVIERKANGQESPFLRRPEVISESVPGTIGPDTQNSVPEVTPQEAEDNVLSVSKNDLPIRDRIPTERDLENNQVAQILKEMPEAETFKDKLERIKRIAKREIVDHQFAVRELSRKLKKPTIIAKADYAMLAPNMAGETIANRRYKLGTAEVIGESLSDIMGDLNEDQKQILGEYVYHWRNIDSTTVRERLGEDYENKYVFGESVGKEESEERIAEIEAENEWVKDRAERIWEFCRQNRQMLVDGGIISQEQADNYEMATPHYVPITRNVNGSSGVEALDPDKVIKRFKGSTIDILPLEHALISQTQNVYRSVLSNSLHDEIMKAVGNLENVDADMIEDILDNGYSSLGVDQNGGKRMYAYRNGQKFSMPVDDELYEALTPPKNPWGLPNITPLQTIAEFRRNLITGWNPMFMVTNAVKDIQDAAFNTKYAKTYIANYAEAWAQIASKGEFYQLYLANGGGQNSYINELGNAKTKGNNAFKKGLNAVVSLNEAVETAPRLAEFIATLKDGKSIEEAMYNAAEVTTNFKRGGDAAKYINRNGCAFLNASIQGFYKQVRNIQDAKDGGFKGMLTYMAKAVLIGGVPLYVLNHLMWKDDDDYEELSDYVKANYYCIMKYGDGKFIRIPKGRLAAFFQTVLQNGVDTLEGKTKMWEALLSDLDSFMDNVAPNNPIENFIATPLIDAANNRTWYGEQLIPTRLQDVPDSEQFDETTDELSIAIGKLSKKVADATGMSILELSPYKINYVLDQYSGAIGDIGLPMITPKTDVGIDDPVLKGLASPWLDKFTTDSVLKNRNVSEFYSLRDEMTKLANSENATDEHLLASKYLYSVASEMGDLYKEKRAVQGDPNLSNKEKYDRVREIQKQINELAKTGLANYDQADVTDRYATIGGVQYYKSDDGKWVKPSSSSLEKLNNANLSEEDRSAYYETFADITSIRNEIKNNTPAGEKANYTSATIEAISNSKLSAAGKNALYDSYFDSKFTSHVNSMSLSEEDKYRLKVANKMAEGTKDENGKTVANSKAQAVADAYKELGLLEDVLKYIKDNDIAPSEMGLSKTVYNQLTGGSSYRKAYSKNVSKGSSKKSTTKTASNKLGKKFTSKLELKTEKEPKKLSGNYLKAYSNKFKTGKSSASSDSSVSTCPRCKNKVVFVNGRCPVCGFKGE